MNRDRVSDFLKSTNRLSVYHRIGAKHLHRYIDAFRGAENMNAMDTDQQMAEAVKVGVGKEPGYRNLIYDDY